MVCYAVIDDSLIKVIANPEEKIIITVWKELKCTDKKVKPSCLEFFFFCSVLCFKPQIIEHFLQLIAFQRFHFFHLFSDDLQLAPVRRQYFFALFWQVSIMNSISLSIASAV